MVAVVKKFVALEVARIASRSSEMDVAAKRVKAAAVSEAAKHRDSGAQGDSIVIVRSRNRRSRGVEDRVVMVTDPLGAIKEFGHVMRNADGEEIGYVPGNHVMQRALSKIPAVSGD
jgi:hypothetical protein